ncbi:hypothetical protein ACLIIZ_03175 [Azonexus caeni]|uniref:hypothetical protein n=1 Tax=Azonexus caeni TaxID=266126 RepID=UPI003A8AC6DC
MIDLSADLFREFKIAIARRLMVAGYLIARRSSAWMTELINGRSDRQVERMESDKGIL